MLPLGVETMMMLALVVAACAATPAPSPAPCGAGAYYDDLTCAGGDCCRSCPAAGALCDAEATLLSALPLAAGYWRAAADSAEVFECARRSHCDGGRTVGAYCARGRGGALCGGCAGDFSRRGDGACARCPAAPGGAGRLAAPRFLAWLLVAGALGAAARRARRPVGAESRLAPRAKLLLAGAQIVGATTWTLEDWRLPAWFRAVAKALNVLNLDADALVPLGCVIRRDSYVAALPWATLAPIAAVGCVHGLSALARGRVAFDAHWCSAAISFLALPGGAPAAARDSRLRADFNVFDAALCALRGALDESTRSVQNSAEATSLERVKVWSKRPEPRAQAGRAPLLALRVLRRRRLPGRRRVRALRRRALRELAALRGAHGLRLPGRDPRGTQIFDTNAMRA